MSEYPWKKYIFETTDKDEAEVYLKAREYVDAVEDIWQQCFRPRYKHGYGDELLDSEQAGLVIDKLAEIYRKVLEDNDL